MMSREAEYTGKYFLRYVDRILGNIACEPRYDAVKGPRIPRERKVKPPLENEAVARFRHQRKCMDCVRDGGVGTRSRQVDHKTIC